MKARSRGFSMVELMVAILISVVVIDAAVSLLLANRQTGNTTAAISAVSDNGRLALSFISETVRSAGYMACNATNDMREILTGSTRQINIIPAGATAVQHSYTTALAGFEAAGSGPNNTTSVAIPLATISTPVTADTSLGDWNGGLDGLLASKVTKGSDVLVVRESMPQIAPIYTTAAYTTGTGQVLLSVNSLGTLAVGQFAAISNCTISTAFKVTAVGGAGITTNGDLLWSYEFPASITPIDMYIYYIGPGRDNDSSLWVYDEFKGTFSELVPDVENMQVLYGVASTNPNQATVYVTADNVVDFNEVVSVKVALLVASPLNANAVQTPTAASTLSLLYTSVTPPLDARLRRVFDTTIAVRSATL